MNNLLDIKYALRLLFKAPKFTALTLFVLVGGLSISLFTFSFLYTSIYKPLPIPEGESALQVVVLLNGDQQKVPAYEFAQIRNDLSSFKEIGIYKEATVRLNIGEVGKNLMATFAQPDLFHFSRIQPMMGRTVQTQDLLPGAEPVAVISYETWQNELQGKKSILGETIQLSQAPTTIIGVMPPDYHFPRSSRVWLPLADNLLKPAPNSTDTVNAFARLEAGISISDAENELADRINLVYQQGVEQHDKPEGEIRISLQSFPLAIMGGDGALIFSFFNLVAFSILLLACVNIGNLLLARAIERRKETAIRAALGAPGKRLVIQLMWEGILITTVGVLLSVLLVGAALDYTDLFLRSHIPNGLAFWWRWGLDGATLIMALGFATVTLFLASFLPAWRAAKQDISATLRDGTRGAQSGQAGRLSRILVTTQVFLISILMLIGSISAFMSYRLLNLDIGVDMNGIMSAEFALSQDSGNRYKQADQQAVFYQRLVNGLDQQRHIAGAQTSSTLGKLPLQIPSLGIEQQAGRTVLTKAIIVNELTFGLTLYEGRSLGLQDHSDTRRTALISQSLANRYWPGQSALEQSLQIQYEQELIDITVVGIVNDQMNGQELFSSKEAEDELYVSGHQFITADQSVWFKSLPGSADAVAHHANRKAEEAFYQTLFSIDQSIQPRRVRVAKENFELMQGSMKLTANITFLAGGFALLLALTGIYGLTANAVTQRTHEIGVRRAVGASDRQIISLFLRQGSKQLIIGLGMALLIFSIMAFIFHQFAGELLPWSFYIWLVATVGIGLSSIVMAAIFLPTRKSVCLEPGAALRYE